MMIVVDILIDAFFAALAAIGFASISNPPRSAYKYCALIAALGHACRFICMSPDLPFQYSILLASGIAGVVVGFSAVFLMPRAKCPAETCFFPALLPMIPGMYAYKAISALVLCLAHYQEDAFIHHFYLLTYNSFMCVFIVLIMVVGAMIPIFLFRNTSFQATR